MPIIHVWSSRSLVSNPKVGHYDVLRAESKFDGECHSSFATIVIDALGHIGSIIDCDFQRTCSRFATFNVDAGTTTELSTTPITQRSTFIALFRIQYYLNKVSWISWLNFHPPLAGKRPTATIVPIVFTIEPFDSAHGSISNIKPMIPKFFIGYENALAQVQGYIVAQLSLLFIGYVVTKEPMKRWVSDRFEDWKYRTINRLLMAIVVLI